MCYIILATHSYCYISFGGSAEKSAKGSKKVRTDCQLDTLETDSLMWGDMRNNLRGRGEGEGEGVVIPSTDREGERSSQSVSSPPLDLSF